MASDVAVALIIYIVIWFVFAIIIAKKSSFNDHVDLGDSFVGFSVGLIWPLSVPVLCLLLLVRELANML